MSGVQGRGTMSDTTVQQNDNEEQTDHARKVLLTV